MTSPSPVWNRSFRVVGTKVNATPAVFRVRPRELVEGEPVSDTTRRFPRRLQDAFPISEGYRAALILPRPKPHRFSWIAAVALLVWLAWAVLHSPGSH